MNFSPDWNKWCHHTGSSAPAGWCDRQISWKSIAKSISICVRAIRCWCLRLPTRAQYINCILPAAIIAICAAANGSKVIHFYVLHFYYFCISICLDFTIPVRFTTSHSHSEFAATARKTPASRRWWRWFCVPGILICFRSFATFASIWQNITEMTEDGKQQIRSENEHKTNLKIQISFGIIMASLFILFHSFRISKYEGEPDARTCPTTYLQQYTCPYPCAHCTVEFQCKK